MSEISEGAREAATVILNSVHLQIANVLGGKPKTAGEKDIAEVAALIQRLAVAPVEAEAAQWQEASGQANVRTEQLEDALAKAERQRDEACADLERVRQEERERIAASLERAAAGARRKGKAARAVELEAEASWLRGNTLEYHGARTEGKG